MSNSDAEETKTSIHQKCRFDTDDADVTFQSSDGIQFKLHRKYLEAYTGAFPGDSARELRSDRPTDVTHLTESAEILEILFQFVYPRRHPSLEGLAFKDLAPLAEAVEKYEVYSAMTICQIRLKPFIPEYALEILVHGIKHDYSELVNEAALHLSRNHRPLDQFLIKLPNNAMFPWIRYSEAWGSIFEKALQLTGVHHNEESSATDIPCDRCQTLIVTYIVKLERVSSLSTLSARLDAGLPAESAKVIGNCRRGCPQAKTATKCMERVIKLCKDGITSMRPFTEFLKETTG
ncbi:hypothetical protein CVT25_009499 [Psilocybe cyanescens]|uniref:BTB domain-containing protein n=1 Tax=Psilocybe cyanescens TaxID=93625 RepID=A0A409XB02_PSICY|nr:hypothetical protein CVT25_009499 [Psilocybe cyanescens]